jgi:hypothetical protein
MDKNIYPTTKGFPYIGFRCGCMPQSLSKSKTKNAEVMTGDGPWQRHESYSAKKP